MFEKMFHATGKRLALEKKQFTIIKETLAKTKYKFEFLNEQNFLNELKIYKRRVSDQNISS